MRFLSYISLLVLVVSFVGAAIWGPRLITGKVDQAFEGLVSCFALLAALVIWATIDAKFFGGRGARD